MAIRLDREGGGYEDLGQHIGHEFECVSYGTKQGGIQGELVNISLECMTCNEVVIDFNNPDMEED